MSFPTFVQWKQLFNKLSRKDKITLVGFGVAAIVSATVLCVSAYFDSTKAVAADNGTYVEGVIGAPTFLNPVYSDFSGADRDISQLLYAGLLKYDQNQIVGDLADYKISDDGKTYEFIIKDDLKWSDGTKITSDDALYTIATIQDPAYKSPLRSQWIGVTAQRISDTGFRLTLNEPYAAFLENCTLKIIPKHIWANVSPESFPLSQYNLNPVVSGPYIVKKINLAKNATITSIDLAKNNYYRGQVFHLSHISFMFFPDYDSLVAAFKRGQIQGFIPGADFDSLGFSGANITKYTLPRYFGIFFNPDKNKIFADRDVRKALAYATDKNEIISGPLKGFGSIIDSPVLANVYGISAPAETYSYDLNKANEILDKAGYKLGADNLRTKSVNRTPAFQFKTNLRVGSSASADIKELQKCLKKEIAPDLDTNGNFGKNTQEAVKKFQEKYRSYILDPQGIAAANGEVKQATREKLNEICFPSGNENTALQLTLVAANQEPFIAIAQMIKMQWAKIGVSVDIKTADIGALERDVVKPRDYDALLFGQAFGAIPDFYPFWHSTQKEDPGLNFSLYENKDADKLLENIRKNMDIAARNGDLGKLQDMIAADAPLIELYNPDYIFITSADLKGVQPRSIATLGQRFSDISSWYTTTKRVLK